METVVVESVGVKSVLWRLLLLNMCCEIFCCGICVVESVAVESLSWNRLLWSLCC